MMVTEVVELPPALRAAGAMLWGKGTCEGVEAGATLLGTMLCPTLRFPIILGV